MTDRSTVVGVDAGGTFTDVVEISRTGAIRVGKVPSTPSRPVDAVRRALAETVEQQTIARLVHATTVATNAMLERQGARVCLLITAGFEDVPSIQRINRRYAFDLSWRKPKPLAPRRHTIGVRERVDANGLVVERLEDEEVQRIVDLVTGFAAGGEIDAIAVCLLFSYLDDEHELMLERALAESLPEMPVSLSSRVSPLWREYERASTTIADAYVKPLMSGFLSDLDGELSSDSRRFPLLVLKSSGGTGAPASVVRRPVTTLVSGLAGGAIAAEFFARGLGEPRCLTVDIGGTSTDIGLVDDGEVRQVGEFEIDWGIPVVTPVVDVHAVGAGGGSIAHVDAGGLLHVGPESAGADPGPAAYGRGGMAATVTDANLVLGRLDPAYFLGGRIGLDVAAADAAVRGVAKAMAAEIVDTALAIVAIANENVANAIRLLTIERGIDPRTYSLIAFGGAGPLHAAGIADALDLTRVVIPPHPGVCSAFGTAIARLRVDRMWSIGVRADDTSERELRVQFEVAETDGVKELKDDGYGASPDLQRSVSCRYYLQNYEQDIPIPDLADGFLSRAVADFHQSHRTFYGYAFEGDPVELVHGKVSAAETRGLPLANGFVTSEGSTEIVGEREIATGPSRTARVPILRRGVLADEVRGPLIVEEPDSTTYVPPGWRLAAGELGCLLLTRVDG